MLHVVPASTASRSYSRGRAKAADLPSTEALLQVGATLARIVGSNDETAQPDLAIIDLGRQFIPLAIAEDRATLIFFRLDEDANNTSTNEAWRAAHARVNEATARVEPLANAILRTRARGLAGLIVKAAVALWCNVDLGDPTADVEQVTNISMGISIVRDLLAIAEGMTSPSKPAGQARAPAGGGAGNSDDGVFAAIERHRQAEKGLDALFAQIDEIEGAAFKSDPRPDALVSWRNYDLIGGTEIERARDEFLAAPNANRAQITREYRQKKAEFRALQIAQRRWDKKHGASDLRRRAEACRRKYTAAEQLLEYCEPTTIAGAAALAEYAHADLKIGGKEWPIGALRMVAQALKRFAPSPRLADTTTPPAVASDTGPRR